MAVYVPNPTPGAGSAADVIEDLGAAMAQRYAEAEQQMIERIATLARQAIDIPPDLVERARVLHDLRLEGERIAAELRDPVFVNEIVATAAADGEQAAIARLGIGGRIDTTSGITGTAANAIGQIALDLTNSLDQMSGRITRYMPDAYQKVISLVAPQVILGIDTLAQAQQRAAEQFLAQGVQGFTDTAGRQWRIGTYSEMATRTTVNRAWMDANIGAQQANGINLVSIIIGANACKACAQVSGKIYSTDGTPAGDYTIPSAIGDGTVTVTVAGTLDDARSRGWNHPNCRCVPVAYFAGLPIAQGSTYSPKGEKDRDRQRALERRVRDLKRHEAAALDDVTARRYAQLIKQAQADIRDHVAETGQIRRNYREQLAFSDGTRYPLGSNPPKPGPRPVVAPTPRITSTGDFPKALDQARKRIAPQ